MKKELKTFWSAVSGRVLSPGFLATSAKKHCDGGGGGGWGGVRGGEGGVRAGV